MPRFFIDRPIFAWVVSIFITLMGLVSITQLPIAQYPDVAPPSIQIQATYPGASAATIDESVVSIIELELNGTPGLISMESLSQAIGTASITVTFESGTDIDQAQVEVQNRLARATPRLPSVVNQLGVRVLQSTSNFLKFVVLTSEDPNITTLDMGDYASRVLVPELQRVPGVGQVQLFGAEQAMRVWLDPEKLRSFSLSAAEVNAAIRSQNALVPAGSIGDQPSPADQTMASTVIVQGQLSTVKEFGNIVLRTRTDGTFLRLRDVARIELGGQSYNTSSRLNGAPAVGLGIQLSPGANAVQVAADIKTRLKDLKRFFPQGVEYAIPYDTSTFVTLSIRQVVQTLFEAIVLVFIVMYVFLQNFRFTLIPALVVPVTLIGTFAVMLVAGFSINVLTMFGLVLAIGNLVDDAIVVVENVERIMATEGLSPRDATIKAMTQITSPIIGTSIVLVAVFLPMAFFGGSVGNIYKQFSLTIAVAIFISTVLALSMTPALCATLLKPVDPNAPPKKGFFGWFNRRVDASTAGYGAVTARFVKRPFHLLVSFVLIVVMMAWLFIRLPSSFLPTEDQGSILVNVQLPPGATAQRTEAVFKQVEDYFLAQPEVKDIVGVVGFSLSGFGQNAAVGFINLKDWSERTDPSAHAQQVAGRAFGALSRIRDAFVFPLIPPAIPELGTATGVVFRLQDRAGLGHDALQAARRQMVSLAQQSPVLGPLRFDGIEDAPQLRVIIDRDKALAMGVSIDSLNSSLSTNMGSSYINDFPNNGRLQRVTVQADSAARASPEGLLKLTALNNQGQPVPFSAFARTEWTTGQMQAVRYNGYPAVRLSGDAAAGFSTGQAMEEVIRLSRQLPDGIGLEWTGLSREEREAGSRATLLLGFSLVAVFLVLAALYESWAIPLAVMLVVPVGIAGSVLGVTLRGMENDVYFTVALINVVGLSAKNAILIVEFAKDLQEKQGWNVVDAVLEACKLRFRPIVMTSVAFILGVAPLFFATGPGSAGQRAIGTGVLSGTLAATALAIFFVPIFFVLVRRFFPWAPKPHEIASAEVVHDHKN